MTVLKIVDGARMPSPRGLSGAIGCRHRTTKPNTNSAMLKTSKRDRVLLPILRAGVDEVLEPFEHARRAVFPVHQPGEIGAERDRQHDRREEEQCR